MTTTKILGVAGVVWSIILIAAGASFREALHGAPHPSARESVQENTQDDFDQRWMPIRKGDRLRLPASPRYAMASAQPEVPAPVASPPQQPELATDDDIRQAEAEHHRHRDVCPHGRTWFTMEKHRYWRCKL